MVKAVMVSWARLDGRPRRPSATMLGGALLLAAVSVAPLCFAQGDADRATARELAKDGYNALKEQDFQTAEDRFRRADSLVHSPLLVIDHARSLIGLGRYVEAQERLALVLREGIPTGAPTVWNTAIPTARELLAQVEPKVAWLTIVVRGAQQPQVTVDEKAVPSMALGVRRAADPGDRTIVVSAEGYLSQTTTVTLSPGGERVVEVDLVVDPNAARAASSQGSDAQGRSARPFSESEGSSKRSSTLAYVALGVGGAGLAAGTVLGIMALGRRSDLKTQCIGSSCPESSKGTIDDYHLYGTLSGVGFGVGLAGVATGVVLLLTNRSEESSGSGVSLVVSPTEVGLQGAF
jgi:hypothetical protein